MDLDGIRVEEEAPIARIVIDRPPVNAFAASTYEALSSILGALEARDDLYVVVVHSAHEKIFSAGADIKALKKTVEDPSPEADEERQKLAHEAYARLRNLAQPTIAVVNGPALGAGAVIAACCDIRIGSSRARIGLPEINVARCGGGRHMMRLVPQGILRRMYFTGVPLDAHEARHLGVFDQVTEPGQELDAGLELAGVIASKSPLALRLAKQALNGCESLPVEEGYALEQQHTLQLGRSEDAREAARSFLEKREPIWVGR